MPSKANVPINLEIIEKDGLLTSAGIGVGVAAMYMAWGIVLTMAQAAVLLLHRWLAK